MFNILKNQKQGNSFVEFINKQPRTQQGGNLNNLSPMFLRWSIGLNRNGDKPI